MASWTSIGLRLAWRCVVFMGAGVGRDRSNTRASMRVAGWSDMSIRLNG